MKDHSITSNNFVSRQKDFLKANPDLWVMIRPDRPYDQSPHRYPDDEARRKGNEVMEAWFEYLAAKGFVKTLNTWLSILKSGRSIMVVCDDPKAFDLGWVPPCQPATPTELWKEFELSRVAIDRRYDQGERERIIEGFKKLKQELRAGPRQKHVPGWSTLGDVAKSQLREWKSIPLAEVVDKPLPQLSAELRAKLGAGIPEISE